MKRIILMAVAVALLTACEKPIVSDEDTIGTVVVDDEGNAVPTKKFTFTIKGDFSDTWKQTRGYLQADGREMTDLWVFDFVGDECVQSLHQDDNTADDFGRPVINLALGSHHIYFVASRGATPTLNETAKTLTWATVRDTFWKDYEVSVVSSSNGNRAVTLDRVVTKMRITINDEVPAGCATLTIAPETWYYGLNYTTGAVIAMSGSTNHTVSVPSSYIGTSGDLTMSIFGFSGTTEWTTNMTITAKDVNEMILGNATINNAPFVRNRITEYSGNLFSSNGGISASLNETWMTAITGTW